jgi:hypothetical protein
MWLWEQAREFAGWVKERPAERRFIASVPTGNIKDDPMAGSVTGASFVPGASYFSIRLVEMHLANEGEWFKSFLPLCVTLAEFSQGDQLRAVPFIVNNDLVKEALSRTGSKGGAIRFENVYSVRHAPVGAGNLCLFTGLFRVTYNDVAEKLIDLVADVGRTVGGEAVGKGADVAKMVYGRLGGIFGMDTVELRVGSYDGNALMASGYRVFAGLPADTIDASQLFMVGGRLHRGTSPGEAKPVTDVDYCVVALEHRASLAEQGMLTSLPFHKMWQEVVPPLTQRKAAETEAAFQKLTAAVLLSPQLSETDRLIVLASYQKLLADLAEALSGDRVVGGTRGPATDSIKDGLVAEADEHGTEAATADVLNTIVDELSKPDLPDRKSIESGTSLDATAAAFRKSLGDLPPDPALSAKVAAALTSARLRQLRN